MNEGESVDPICTTDDAGIEVCVCPSNAYDYGFGGTSDTWDSGEGGSGVPLDPLVALSWDEFGMVLTIVESAENGPYLFGMAETGNGAEGWYGEDCIDGVSNGADVCHDVPANGELTLTHVNSVADVGDATTLANAAVANGLTYVLIRDTAENFGCWTWGHNPAFYRDPPLGCPEISPVNR